MKAKRIDFSLTLHRAPQTAILLFASSGDSSGSDCEGSSQILHSLVWRYEGRRARGRERNTSRGPGWTVQSWEQLLTVLSIVWESRTLHSQLYIHPGLAICQFGNFDERGLHTK